MGYHFLHHHKFWGIIFCITINFGVLFSKTTIQGKMPSIHPIHNMNDSVTSCINFLVRSNSVRNFTVTYLSCRTIIRLGLEGLDFLYQVWLGGFGVCLRYLACWGWVAWQKNKVFANLVRASLCRPPSLVLHDCLSSFHYCVGTGVQSMATGDFNSVLKKGNSRT